MFKISLKILVIFLLIFPTLIFAATTTERINAGFVTGLWYSKKPFFVGDMVRVYTAFQNRSGHDLQGDVKLYVDGHNFATLSIRALNGSLIDSWGDWKATDGNHRFTAGLANMCKAVIGGACEPIELEGLAEFNDDLFVDTDTDGDGIGDRDDPDDDNDGISDVDEIRNGTNPRDVKDKNNNGIDDKLETNNGSGGNSGTGNNSGSLLDSLGGLAGRVSSSVGSIISGEGGGINTSDVEGIKDDLGSIFGSLGAMLADTSSSFDSIFGTLSEDILKYKIGENNLGGNDKKNSDKNTQNSKNDKNKSSLDSKSKSEIEEFSIKKLFTYLFNTSINIFSFMLKYWEASFGFIFVAFIFYFYKRRKRDEYLDYQDFN